VNVSDAKYHNTHISVGTETGEPLRMQILGPGGTGKSLLIGAITETFEFYNCSSRLAKTATSGIAASDIGGQTIHSWCGLPINVPRGDDWVDKAAPGTKTRRARNMQGKWLLIIDEVSMLNKTMLFCISEIINHCLAENGEGNLHDAFRGLDIILTGDYHQFPPVAGKALYQDDSLKDGARDRIGRELFKLFDTVIMLTQQVRVCDQGWTDILNRLRIGDCTDHDLDEINKLIIGNPRGEEVNFRSAPWNEAILVTPRHAVREEWNDAALKRHCKMTRNRRYVVNSEDFDKVSGEELSPQCRLAVASMDSKHTGKLPDRLQLAVGMKAMVLLNVSTEGDIANGTRGTITDIVLDPREPPTTELKDGSVRLVYPPALVMFKPDKPSKLTFDGIDDPGVVPILPTTATFTASFKHNGSPQSVKVKRRQYAMTAGYAFTDYKSQGQTIEYVIIDLSKPPGGGGSLSPFNAYVALSRSRGRQNIRLLRKYDEELFIHHPSEDLRVEMVRLHRLERETAMKNSNMPFFVCRVVNET